jgi:hypothetical protein
MSVASLVLTAACYFVSNAAAAFASSSGEAFDLLVAANGKRRVIKMRLLKFACFDLVIGFLIQIQT